MSAQDHLNQQQFMQIGDMDKLPSQYGGTMEDAYHGTARFDASADEIAQYQSYDDSRAYQRDLTQHIAEHGMANPIALDPKRGYVANGHHRYFAAKDLGWTHVPVEPWQSKPVPDVPGWDK